MWKDPFFVIVSSFLILGCSSFVSSLCKHSKVSSPAPSPGSGFGLGGGGKSVDKPRDDLTVNPKGSDVRDECSTASDACRDRNKLSAWLVHSGDGTRIEGGISCCPKWGRDFFYKALYTPANISAQDIVLGKQRIEKVNVMMENVGGSLIVLNAGFGECVIHLPATVLGHHIDCQFPFATSVNPFAWSLPSFGNALIVVGIWDCCRSGKSERQVDLIPYQELEMGKTDVISANDKETPEGWDDDWDDDWDEIREVKPSGRKVAGSQSLNAIASKSGAAIARNGWEDNWDD